MRDINKKNVKSIFFIVGMLQAIYFIGYYPDLKNRQHYLENEIEIMNQTMNQAKNITNQKKLEQKLENLERQLYVMTCKIPLESEDACNTTGLLKALKQYPLQQIEITKTGESVPCLGQLETLENQYSISYQGDFENVKSFVQNIRYSTQLIHINGVTIKPFTTKEKKRMAEATLNISTFVRKKDSL